MKINGNFEVEVKTDPACEMGAPLINVKATYSLDCTEAEHALCVHTFQKFSDDWLEVKQEFIKSLVCTPSFKDMVSAGWAMLTRQLKAS